MRKALGACCDVAGWTWQVSPTWKICLELNKYREFGTSWPESQLHETIVSAVCSGIFFVQKQGLDVNLFAIMNDGSGVQPKMLNGEGAYKDSNSAMSQLQCYVLQIDTRAGRFINLMSHMDFCIGQNKNNIMLGFRMSWVLHIFHEKVKLRYMMARYNEIRSIPCFRSYQAVDVLGEISGVFRGIRCADEETRSV